MAETSTPAAFRFHAAAMAGEWLNDPNGLAFIDGRYRLFAQHSSAAPAYKEIGWASFSSDDLLDWRADGIAIPYNSPVSAFSGCVTGVAPFEAFLTLHDAGEAVPLQRQHRAEGQPAVIDPSPLGPEGRNARDPFVFWCTATGDWRMLVAEPCDWTDWRTNPPSALGVWASTDKRDWRLVGRLGPWDEPGIMWEVPLLLDFGEEQLLILSKVDRREDRAVCSVEATRGRFGGESFVTSGATAPLDLGPDFYAACANTIDGWPSGERMIVGWASSWATARAFDWPGGAKGGPISLPRRLWLEDGRVQVAPIAASRQLAIWTGQWRPGEALKLTVRGDGVELHVNVDRDGQVEAWREGPAPYVWALAQPATIGTTDLIAFVDAGLVELFFAGRALTAFVPGAVGVQENANELGDGIDAGLLAHLRQFDTPTICNALEIATGGRRATGFTRRSMVAPFPLLPPIVGFARTATLRSAAPSSITPERARELRLAYYEHVAATDAPIVVVIQDLDHDVGLGAFWGEVNSKVHRALGCAGVVTNGAVRDLDVLAPDFPILAGCVTPSHAFVRIESIGGDVDVLGMQVADGDLIHADRHGAVVIDRTAAAKLPHAIEVIVSREKLILDAAAQPGFGVEAIRRAMAEGDDIH